MTARSLHTRRIVISAMFLAIALVLRTFTRMYIPLMGESGIRLSLHGIASIMPSILFGPVYGALTSGLTDMLGTFISPSGAWIPWITLNAFAGGFIRGSLWLILRKRSIKVMRWVLVSAGVILLLLGGFNMLAYRRDGITRDFYVRTPARVEAWENNRVDELGTHWCIQTTRTEHTDADGMVYYRILEHSEVLVNLPIQGDVSDAHPRGLRTPETWLAAGRRVLTQRYTFDEYGEMITDGYGVPVLRTSVVVRESNVQFKWLPRHRISRMAIERSFGSSDPTHFLRQFMTRSTTGIFAIGGLFFLLLGLDFAVRAFFNRRKQGGYAPVPASVPGGTSPDSMPSMYNPAPPPTPLPHTTALIVAMMVPAILVSTINTYILSQYVYTSWQLLPFVVVWLPRVVQSMATTTLNFFFVTFLLGLCQQQPALKALIRG